MHEILAETPRGVHQDNAIEPRFGVDREHHARTCEVRPHHLLHADGKAHLEMIEAHCLAIGDGAVGEEGGEAAAAGGKQGILTPYVKEAFLLTGKTRLGQVLGSGA